MKELFIGHKKMSRNKLVFVALDYDSQQKNFCSALKLTKDVISNYYGFKINLDSIVNFSPDSENPYNFIKSIKDLGKPVFVDLKMWNGGRTMENIAKGCVDLGVNIINIYPHAGSKFMKIVKNILAGTNTKLFGLTVLTHYKDEDTLELYGKKLKSSIKMLAKMNYEFGVDGIIIPGNYLKFVKDFSFLKLCPGIRPEWYLNRKSNEQEQIVTPKEAIAKGADYIVVGSPIFKSKYPSESLEKILSEII